MYLVAFKNNKCVANQESCSDIAQEPSRRSMETLWSAEICTELNLKSALVAAIAGWSGRVLSMQPRADSYSKKHSTFRTWPAYQRIKSLQYLATERVPFHPFHPFRYGSMPDSHLKRFQTCRPRVFGSSENHDENTACVWCVGKAPKISTFLVPCFPCPKLLICNSNKTTSANSNSIQHEQEQESIGMCVREIAKAWVFSLSNHSSPGTGRACFSQNGIHQPLR